MIRLEGIRREYRTGALAVHALRGVDLHIPPGSFSVLMGPSGSGKSTLLHILGCLDRPTSGTYTLDGKEVTALPDTELVLLRRFSIGFVFQSFHLVPRMSATANVELPMIFAGVPASERERRAIEALESVGLADRVLHRPDELSGGERQRVAIARSLVMKPAVLLADEPTGNLDTASGEEVLQLLLELHRQGNTILLVTHDERLARIGDTLIRLRDGEIETLEST
ncbi:MAG: ABC transporter ATP-binding protein [Planctomycetota bacterium]|jgi:putative ABC transport system ATP-binding protein|nr:ABC transporter ATP-binding protein [Planctomycetota bacterium]